MAGVLTLTDFLTIMDSMAQQAADLDTGFTSAGWANNRATILAEADLVVAGALAAFGSVPFISLSAAYGSRLTALRAHLGDMTAYLTANDKRVHTNLNDILGFRIGPAGIMVPPKTGGDKLGHFDALTATTGTFTDGTAVDITKYGKAWLRLKMTHNITGSLVATIIGTKFDGSAQSKAVTLTGLLNTQTASVGTLGVSGDNYKDVTSVTITGGTVLDAFDIESVEERAIAL